MKKKILIISYSYPPANVPAAQRPYSIAKYLDKEKFDVTVLTCGNQDSSLGFDTTFNEELPNVNLIKINGFKITSRRSIATKKYKESLNFKTKIKQSIFKILSYFVFPDKAILWYPTVLKYINKSTFNFDVIFSTSPAFTNHLIALKIKRKNKKSVHIADFRDFQYLETFKHNKGVKVYLNKQLELNCVKKSDKITFISDAMKNEYQKYYKPYATKFYSIYNGFDLDEYSQNKAKLQSEQLSIFYAGSFYKGVRNPMSLLNILEELLKQNCITVNDIQIEIAGNFETELVNEIKPLKIFKSITFLGQLPRNEVLKKYKESHLLWLIVGDKVSHYTGVPVKFYEYLASQRPIINFAPSNSEPTSIINDLDLGWNFNTDKFNFNDQVNLFKTIIDKYKSGNLKNSLDLSKTEKYSRKKQTKILENIIND